jgi:predicted DNA-binding transcriptional regulator YafY
MDTSKTENILRLIQLLIGNNRTNEELAQLLSCNVRTVQRYIEQLRNARFVVESYKRGVYFICPDNGALKEISDLVHFTEEEAYLLHKAIDSIDDNTTLKQNLKKKLYNIYHYSELADVVVRPEQGEVVRNLIWAMEEKLCVELINYRSSNSNKVSTRFVEPFAFTTNYQQAWCYEPSSGKSKLFKVARIEKVKVHEDRPWQHQQSHNNPEVDVFRISAHGYIANAKLLLNIRAYNLLIEEYPLAEKYITKQTDNQYIFDAPICSFDGVGRFIMGLFEDIQVLGDERLKEFIRQKILRLKSIATESVV